MESHRTRQAVVFPSLFLLSAAGLAVEVALVRLFSFLFVQSYVYIVISLSVSGIGFGAVLMHYLGRRRGVQMLRVAPLLPVLGTVTLFAVNSFGSALVPSLVATFVIYLAFGMAQVHIFRDVQFPVSQLYAADLGGAATGSLTVFLLLNTFSAPTTILVVSAMIGVAVLGSLIATGDNPRWLAFVAVGVFLIATAGAFIAAEDRMRPTENWQKEMTVMLEEPGAQILETRWSAFGRVDVVTTANPTFRTMFIDGGAGTKIIRMPGGQVTRDIAETLLYQYMGGLPTLAIDRDRRNAAAVVGSGGGIDVVTLLIAGFRSIDAIEINPDFIDLVRGQEDYAGPIYGGNDQVTIHNAEGRAFLRNTDQRYDLILMSLPIIKSVRNFGNHALTENYLFTREAFAEYRAALAEDGMVVVVAHYRNEVLRLLVNALRSFESDGVSPQEAAYRIVLIGDQRNPTLVLKNQAFSPRELEVLAAIIETIPTVADGSYVPGVSNPNAAGTFSGMVALAGGRGAIDDIVAAADEDISAVTDESPFFYQLVPGIPREIQIVGIAVILLLLVLLTLFLLDTRRGAGAHGWDRTATARFLAFALIGVGFISVEIAILQRFIVFWQHQTLALAIVLAAILAAGGLGSLLASRIDRASTLAAAVAVGVAAMIAGAWGIAPLLRVTEGSTAVVKVLLTAGVSSLFFLPLGMVFPTLLTRTAPERYPWMIGINSVTTLAGSVLALVVAMSGGYRFVMIAGATSYAVLIVLLLTTRVIPDSPAVRS